MGHPSRATSVLFALTSAHTTLDTPFRGHRRALLAPLVFAAALLGAGCGSAGTGSPPGTNNPAMSGAGAGGSGDVAAGTGVAVGGTGGVVAGTGMNPIGGSGTVAPVGGTGAVAAGDDGGTSLPVTSGTPNPVMTSPPVCVATGGTTGPALPPSFALVCSGCHSAFGSAGNPEVPNLFTYVNGGSTCTTVAGNKQTCSPIVASSSAAFLAQVRTPTALAGAPTGATVMPGFPSTAISDADVTSIYNYFKAGTPAPVATCAGAGGTVTANVGSCQGKAATFSPL